jgi:hypothetical protein
MSLELEQLGRNIMSITTVCLQYYPSKQKISMRGRKILYKSVFGLI